MKSKRYPDGVSESVNVLSLDGVAHGWAERHGDTKQAYRTQLCNSMYILTAYKLHCCPNILQNGYTHMATLIQLGSTSWQILAGKALKIPLEGR